MSRDPLLDRHREWLAFVRPTGLVVAPAVLAERQVALETRAAELQPVAERLAELLEDSTVADPLAVLREVLEWPEEALVPAPPELDRHLRELDVHLRADFAVPNGRGKPEGWLALVKLEEDDGRVDRPWKDAPDGWHASPHARFERLLRETDIAIGLLLTPKRLRLVYAPKSETSGWLDFVFAHMTGTAGRPILAAMRALLRHAHVRAGPPERRLAALLEESRRHQAHVSHELGRQVQEALAILLDGFREAARRADPENGLRTLAQRPKLYEALVTVMMRLVFLLYAEERDLLPAGPVYEEGYSVRGLFDRLEEDATRFPESMEDRFGAWAQLLVLFRLVHDGGRAADGEGGEIDFFPRRGTLFDPDRHPLLEGREPPFSGVPTVSDRHVHGVLEKLLVLNGERLSYRTLDVEEIGSVYQKIMGFTVEVTRGPTLAIRPGPGRDAAVHVNLDELLHQPAAQRGKWFRELTGHALPAAAQRAGNVEELEEALDRLVQKGLTPKPLAAGIPVLQPTEERRRTGSHYTPRELTEPIVRKALRPVFERLGARPTAEQILGLRILDPAMGSGAFLVEACRQLAEKLVEAWNVHGDRPSIPADEDDLLHAKRLVATRCLHGVDRNPLTVELAKLSLWLETLAAWHEFTFLDHNLRCGDSLVGLLLPQLEGLHFDPVKAEAYGNTLLGRLVRERLTGLCQDRETIETRAEKDSESTLADLLRQAERRIADLQRLADAIVAAFFRHGKPKERERAIGELRQLLEAPGSLQPNWHQRLDPRGVEGLHTFHWPLAFPEVFLRDNPGFDVVVGNPPFAGKNNVAAGNPDGYPEWLRTIHPESHGNADLCAHFFRRAFDLLRREGTFGLLATNTIAQGDTRATGLRWIRRHGGEIYRANRRYAWPGEAAVVVSVVHVHKGPYDGPRKLDGRPVDRITAFLSDRGGDDDPARLEANAGLSFIGSYVLGMGFTFDDTDRKGVANPISLMEQMIRKDPRNDDRIFPYIGGDEVNEDPEHRPHRWVINFEDFPLERRDLGKSWVQADEKQRRAWLRTGVVPLDYPHPVAADWPDLLKIVEERVKPERLRLGDDPAGRRRKKFWWQFGGYTPGLYEAIRDLPRVLVISRVSAHAAFTFLPNGWVYSEALVVFALPEYSSFAALQSRVHEAWVHLYRSSLVERPRYTPSDCFETFPLPPGFRTDPRLEDVGRAYYEHRAELMKRRGEGLTKTYNRFHDPRERGSDIERLRELHAEMDRAVLRAYGWDDLADAAHAVFVKDDDPDHAYHGRLHWDHGFRWEVLARLLELNRQRKEEEEEEKRAAAFAASPLLAG